MPFFGNLSTIEWIIIGVVVVVLFGGTKLKEVARGLGESGKELKRIRREFRGAIEDDREDLPEHEIDEKKTKTKKG